MLYDPVDPTRLLWRGQVSFRPVHDHARHYAARLAWRDQRITVRFRSRERGFEIAVRTLARTPHGAASRPAPCPAGHAPVAALLKREVANPLLAPIAAHAWESQAVFNPAALALDGRVELIYRAVGEAGLSVFGHACLEGSELVERSSTPVQRHVVQSAASGSSEGDAQPWVGRSGQGLSGGEDPRLTRLGDRVYMTYTAFDGTHASAVALTSIPVEDLRARRWHWSAPVVLPPPGEAHKNWVLFPERIGGHFAVLHGISPGVQIALLDRLDAAATGAIHSHYACTGDPHGWDNRVRGVAAPPLRTAAGWLVLYHAMDRRDPDRYKLGALLLDPDDPQRVLGRLAYPHGVPRHGGAEPHRWRGARAVHRGLCSQRRRHPLRCAPPADSPRARLGTLRLRGPAHHAGRRPLLRLLPRSVGVSLPGRRHPRRCRRVR